MWVAFSFISFSVFSLNPLEMRACYPRSLPTPRRATSPIWRGRLVMVEIGTDIRRFSSDFCVITVVITEGLKPEIELKFTLEERTHPPPSCYPVKLSTGGGFSISSSQRLWIRGRRVNIGLGGYPVVTLAAVRSSITPEPQSPGAIRVPNVCLR